MEDEPIPATWYVLYSGPADDGSDDDPMALALDNEAEAREEFTLTIDRDFADRDRGLFIDKLTGVTPQQADDLLDPDCLARVVREGFQGYTRTRIEAYKTTLADWHPAAVADINYEDSATP